MYRYKAILIGVLILCMFFRLCLVSYNCLMKKTMVVWNLLINDFTIIYFPYSLGKSPWDVFANSLNSIFVDDYNWQQDKSFYIILHTWDILSMYDNVIRRFNSLRPSDASVNLPSLAEIMACRLDSDKPLSEPVMGYC